MEWKRNGDRCQEKAAAFGETGEWQNYGLSRASQKPLSE